MAIRCFSFFMDVSELSVSLFITGKIASKVTTVLVLNNAAKKILT